MTTRRQLLLAVGGTVAAGALAGCTSSTPTGAAGPPDPSRRGASPTADELAPDLLLGYATAAYQIEGAVDVDGRGPTIWDTFCERPGAIKDRTTGAVACDHYHRMPTDVNLMARLRTQTYRFSIAWSRLFPTGRGRLDERGLSFYRELVDRLRDTGIVPLATLYHWDLPQALQDAGGWPARDTALRFADYAATVFERLDGVDRWVTVNEAKLVAMRGHRVGNMAPGISDEHAAGRVVHHLGLAHGLAVQAFRATGRPGQIGPCFAVSPCYPADPTADAASMAKIADMEANTLYFDPILRGRYPGLARELAPTLRDGLASAQRDGDLAIISEPVDFVGLNYYGPTVVDGDGERVQRWTKSPAGHQIYPRGLYDVAVRIHREYGHPVIVTENGIADLADGDPLDDSHRVDYLRVHLNAIRDAMADGVAVYGFHVWSLMDNFEWAQGLSQRWGVVRVDFESQQRTPKRSATWFSDVIATRRT